MRGANHPFLPTPVPPKHLYISHTWNQMNHPARFCFATTQPLNYQTPQLQNHSGCFPQKKFNSNNSNNCSHPQKHKPPHFLTKNRCRFREIKNGIKRHRRNNCTMVYSYFYITYLLGIWKLSSLPILKQNHSVQTTKSALIYVSTPSTCHLQLATSPA